MTLKVKLIEAGGLAFLVLCGVGFFSYWWTLREDENHRWIAHTHTALEQLSTLVADVTTLEADARDYTLTGNSFYQTSYGTMLNRVEADLNQVGGLTADNPEQQEIVKQLRTLVSSWLPGFPERERKIDEPPGAGNEALSLEEVFRRTRTGIAAIDEQERRLLAQRLRSADAGSRQMKAIILLGNILAILFLAGGAYIIHQEMGRRREAEQRLRASEKLSRLMISGVKEYAIFMLDVDGKVTNWNAGAERINGYRSEEILGQHFSRLYPCEDVNRGKPESELKAAALQGQVEDEGWRIRKDGSKLWANVVVTALHDEEETLTGFCSVTRDMTERRQSEEAIQRKNAELEAANKELDAFSYSVAHDLRAPLRAIDGFSLALLEDYKDQIPTGAKGYLDRVRNGASRMGQLIDDLLKLARVSRQQIERSQVDLSRLAEEVATQLQSSSPGRQVRFVITPGISVSGDRSLLRIVLENLLGNAWKFTSKRPDAKVELGMQNGAGEQVVYVSDNGSGFDMQYADKLFGVFQRLHRESEFPGTGVGLATVQRIISRHGGRVWAEAAPGEGATFYFVV